MIVTRGHNHDEEALYQMVNKPTRYLGLIGSRRKIRLIFDDLLDRGITANRLERVHAPLGFDLGHGDQIQFLRYVRHLTSLGGHVSPHLPKALVKLARSIEGVEEFFSDLKGRGKDFEFGVYPLSLPRILSTRVESIPGDCPYLSVPRDRVEWASGKLESIQASDLRVGLVWAGSPRHVNDRSRSIDIRKFEPLLDLDGVTFVSLQTGDSSQRSTP